ncbi:hypothetical protein [Phenylobacterium sp.]|uniref:hypothetical protein n=1 Tax=Phenylobacterium sp. TaxID=1871053 RepID=UPI0019C0A473|nr:hypothetical protein [Phenylobacterium sp.]MBC7169234.1 hypothetical protein [Phenylobacterium sp.]
MLLAGWIQHQHIRSERLADCQAIAAGQLARESGERCPTAIVEQLQAARASAACAAGLGALKGEPGRWGAPAACSARIRDLVARHNVARDLVADRDLELERLRSGQSAALARAEARGASQARRTANAKAAIGAAPRDPAGLIVCGDQCLRQLAGEGSDSGSGADRRASP